VPAPIDKLLSPEEAELQQKKARLAELETQLADRELELAGLFRGSTTGIMTKRYKTSAK
jgi:hypothetical protein